MPVSHLMAQFVDVLYGLSAEPRARGSQFEIICKWFLENDPVYSALVRRAWLWRDWPGRWGADAGIDIVAEAHDGTLWAIQAKAYQHQYSVTKKDVDSFLSESARECFSFRLLIATTDRIGATAKRTIVQQEKPAAILLLSDLQASSADWPESIDRLKPQRRPPKAPLAHHVTAIESVCSGLRRIDRGQLVMACGTGKTLIGLWVAEKLRSSSTLVLLPSLSLLAQTLREWAANSSAQFSFLPLCSDETVGDDDQVMHYTSDLGFPATTDPAAIADFLRSDGRRVVFSTYQSSPRLAEAFRLGAPPFDLAVADEAHRCVGPASGNFAAVLDNNSIVATKRLFMTATPRYLSQSPKPGHEVEVTSMDDTEQFGPVLHYLPFGEAIEAGLLTDYQVVVISADDTARSCIEERRIVSHAGVVTDGATLGAQAALVKAMDSYELRRVISFHGRVNRARSFSQSFGRVSSMLTGASGKPVVWSDYVSGAMPAGLRSAKLQRMRHLPPGERGLLTNARCLSEGVDLPALDAVAFVEPKRAQVDIVQAVGRVMRRSPDKKIGTIVIPVVVNEGEDPERILSGSAFQTVWAVVRALRAHDPKLADDLDELRRSLGRRQPVHGRLPSKIKIDLPIDVGPDFLRAVETRLIESCTPSWEAWFAALQEFVSQQGHAVVPKDHQVAGGYLGPWVSEQRQRFARGRLTSDRQERLETLPGWVWAPRDDRWNRHYESLLMYVEREGDADVPQHHRENGLGLGFWVAQQRRALDRGELAAESSTLLTSLPGWTWNRKEDRWQEAFRHLEDFVSREGHSIVKSSHIENGFALGSWVAGQRQLYRNGSISAERKELLEAAVGWRWNLVARSKETSTSDDSEAPHFSLKWDHALALLHSFIELNGHLNVPQKYRTQGINLCWWVSRQRSEYKGGRLSARRVMLLEATRGWRWDVRASPWEDMFLELQRFVAREGHALVPLSQVEGTVRLGGWVSMQRRQRRRGELSDDRSARLEALPGWTWNAKHGRPIGQTADLSGNLGTSREDHVSKG